MIVLPSSRARESRICMSATAEVLSNPLVGSSFVNMTKGNTNEIHITYTRAKGQSKQEHTFTSA